MPSKLYLKDSVFENPLNGTVHAAAYPGKIVIGRTVLDEQAIEYFDYDRMVTIKKDCFFALMEVMCMAMQRYESQSNDEFEYEFAATAKNNNLTKLMGTFSAYGDHDDAIFQIRYKWAHLRDTDHQTRIRQGKADNLDKTKEWVYLKRGVILDEESLEKFLLYADKYLLATYKGYSTTVVEEVEKFISFGGGHCRSLLNEKITKYEGMKLKQKIKIIDTVLDAWVEGLPPEDTFWSKNFRDLVIDREEAVFALFNKALKPQTVQS